jgi:hypothetical protein
MQNQITSGAATSAGRQAPRSDDRAKVQELQRELGSSNEEILRLRDLLIRRDAELGALRGRLMMIEQGSQRVANALAGVPIPGLARLIRGLIGFLRGIRA